MKNILLLLVGGTICTALTEYGTLSVSNNAGTKLVQSFMESDSPYKEKVQFTVSKNLGILSENMTVDKWNLIIKTYKQEISKKEYDGVIFAHGTDTLAYSTSLFSMLLAGAEIPVFFASSNARLDTPTANGNDNFRCAVECICRGIEPDVYVAYKNISDGRMYLHQGSRLEQCKNYSDDFYSVGAMDITDLSENSFNELNETLKSRYPAGNKKKVVDINDDFFLSDCILLVNPYVGINYSAYNYSSFSAVLHGSYHCGTACVEKSENENKYSKGSILYMLDKCASCERAVDVYFSPSKPIAGTYETVGIIQAHEKNGQKINFLYGTTSEMAYAKLLLGYSVFKDKADIARLLDNEYNFEKISN